MRSFGSNMALIPYRRLCVKLSISDTLLRFSRTLMDPLRFIQLVHLYVVRRRYSFHCRGLMRVKELSALASSISKLTRHASTGRAQKPNRPEYSLINVSPVSVSIGSGV